MLSGENTYDEIVTHDAYWYAAKGVGCRFGEAVVRTDCENRRSIRAVAARPMTS